MKVKVGQHIYGRNKEKGFSTLGYSPDVTLEDLKFIERNCIYELPTALYHDEGTEKPAKYTFYKLNEEKVVVGKGVYIGKDEFGRVGNYIFHNLIFQTRDIVSCEINPVSLIAYLNKINIFIKDAPAIERIDCLELDFEKGMTAAVSPESKAIYNNAELHTSFLYRCLKLNSIEAPIIIEYNVEGELLDFLHRLFSITPNGIWKDLSFNTLWYKDHKFLIRCIKQGFPFPTIDYSIKVDLTRDSYNSKIDISDKAIYEYAKLSAQKALNNESSLSTLYSLQEFAEAADWVRFIEMFKNAPQDIKTIIYNLHKDRIIIEVSQGNAKLFSIIEKAEHNKVFKSKGLINHILKSHDEILAKDFINWFYGLLSIEDKREIYSVFLSNLWLLNLLLDKIRGDKMGISRSAEMIQELIEEIGKMTAEKEGHNEVTEEKLLEGLYEFLDNKPNIDVSRTLKIIKKLPATKNLKILLLRALIRYEIGDNSEFISLIKEEDYKPLIQDLTKGGLKAIDWEKHKRTFQEKEPKSSMFGWLK